MALIQRADLVEKIRELFGVVQGSVGNQLVDEIIPVVIVEDVSGPDNVSTQHPLRALGSSSSAAGGAAFFSKVGLQNPPGSGVDLFVSRISLISSAIQDATIRLSAIAASPSAGIKAWLDRRVDGNPVAVVWDENATATLGTQIFQTRSVARVPAIVELGLTLAPGDSIHAQQSTLNTALGNVHFFWTERVRRG